MNQVESDERFVLQVFRLFRQAVLHDLKNDAVTNTIRHSVGVLEELIRKQHFRLSMVFWGENVFINGHALRAVRSVYKSAVELGAELTQLGINEIIIEAGVNEKDLHCMLSHYNTVRQQAVQNENGTGGKPLKATSSGKEFRAGSRVIMRFVDASLLMGYDERSLGQIERVVRTCTSAAVVLERLHEQLREGRYDLVRFVKRVARNLVQLTEEHPHLLLTFFRIAPQRVDPAYLSLKTAVLAITTTQEVDMDLRQRTNLAMTALLFDVGIVRASGLGKQATRDGLDFMPMLNEDSVLRLPATTATMIAVFGNLNRPSVTRSIFAYEAHQLTNMDHLTFPYEGNIIPTVEAVILATCRAFVDSQAGRTKAGKPLNPSDSIARIRDGSTTNIQRYVLDLFIHSVTLFERGTPVELTSGALGCVVKNGEPGTGRPVIRIAYKSDGTPDTSNQNVDLSSTDVTVLKLGRVRHVVRKPDSTLKSLRRQIIGQADREVLPRLENRDSELYVSGPLYPTVHDVQTMNPPPENPAATQGRSHAPVRTANSENTVEPNHAPQDHSPPLPDTSESTSQEDDSLDDGNAKTERLVGVDPDWQGPESDGSPQGIKPEGLKAQSRRTTPTVLNTTNEQTLTGSPGGTSNES
jgi:hypothetical protein